MRRVAWCLVLLPAAGCRQLPPDPPEPAVRAHVVESIEAEKNWYADWFGLKTGAEVVATARKGQGKSVFIDITTQASATCSLSIYLYENERGEPLVDVLGIWIQDDVRTRGTRFANLVGDVYLEKRLGESATIQLRFALSIAGRKKERVSLMGGVTVIPTESEITEAR